MKVVYIAGPYKAENQWEIEKNIRAAEEMHLKLIDLGVAVICPHTMSRHFFGTYDETTWMAVCRALVRRSDALILLPGWRDSSGTAEEINEADDYGKMMFSEFSELKRWVEESQEVEPAEFIQILKQELSSKQKEIDSLKNKVGILSKALKDKTRMHGPSACGKTSTEVISSMIEGSNKACRAVLDKCISLNEPFDLAVRKAEEARIDYITSRMYAYVNLKAGEDISQEILDLCNNNVRIGIKDVKS